MVYTQYKITVNKKTGEAQRLGIEEGELTVQQQKGSYLVLHCAATTHWAGQGLRTYDPAEYQVYEILSIESDGEADLLLITAGFIVSFPAKHQTQ